MNKLIILLLPMTLLSFRNPKKAVTTVNNNNNELLVCHFKQVKDTIDVPLSTLIESCEMVKLENNVDAFVKGGSTIISENYIGVRNWGGMPFKLFNKQGKFMCNVGTTGRGPNEYTSVYAEQIDEANQRIYLMPWPRKQLYVYDLKGNHLPPIELCYKQNKSRMFVENNKVTMLTMPFTSDKVVAYQQSVDGKLIQEVPAAPYAIKPDFSNELLSSRNTSAYDMYIFQFFKPIADSLYHYNTKSNQLVPRFTINYQEEKVPMHSYYELPNHFIARITAPKQVGKNSFGATLKGYILVDKETKEAHYCRIKNDFLGNIDIYVNFQDGMFINNVPAIKLKEDIEKALKKEKLSSAMREKLKKINSNLNEDDNNVILYGKLKQ